MDYRELPEEFLEKMKQFLGEEYPEYLASYEEEPRSGLRVNTGRLTPEQFLEMAQTADWNLKPVPWTKNGFYYQGERPSRHPWYYAGLYYLQEPSAMSPAAWLPIKPGDRVLDLCAAPGGKSTELAAKLAGTGVLFSNDISNSRAKALLKNLEMFGAGNICVTSEAPEKMAGILPEFFDKILVDAPCSGEGMFRRDPSMVKSWNEKGPDYYAPLQRQILDCAVQMLAPGGKLVYSTCTFDRDEDEGTIEYILEKYPQMAVVPQKREPTCIIKMINNQGEDIFEDYESVQVYQESSAVLMTDILKGVVTKGTAASMGWSGNIEAAGKTGTTNGSRDGWFCGMTPYYTMTVWVGYDQQKTLSSLYGGTYPAKIWKNAMEKMVEGLPAASFDTPETDNGRGEGTYLAGHPDAFEITTSGYTAANFRRDHLLSDEVAKLPESAKSGDSGRSSKELKEDASAKIEQIKSESIKERMQRIYKTGTAGKRYSAPAVVPETAAETVEDPAESSTTIVPAGPGSDIGPGHGPAQEPAVGPAAEIGQ